jgi:hypothetical protein
MSLDKISYPDKVTGEKFFATEFNELKHRVDDLINISNSPLSGATAAPAVRQTTLTLSGSVATLSGTTAGLVGTLATLGRSTATLSGATVALGDSTNGLLDSVETLGETTNALTISYSTLSGATLVLSGAVATVAAGNKGISTKLDDLTAALSGKSNADDVTAIQNLIPVNASVQNPLLTKADYVATNVITDYSGLTNVPTGNYVIQNQSLNMVALTTKATYVITSVIDLAGASIALPPNVTLIFNGGRITNGTLVGSKTSLVATNAQILSGTTLAGSWLNSSFMPEWWGDTTLATYDWRPALQSCLDSAALTGAIVQFGTYQYKYYGSLIVKAGVTMRGVGRGETVLGSGTGKGTVLWCQGVAGGGSTVGNVAIKIVGSMVTASDIYLRGVGNAADVTTGLQFYGIGTQIEGCNFKNIIIHSFLGGIGLHLAAGNAGSVTYSVFENIRTRNCKYHAKIESLSSNPIYGNVGADGNPYTSATGFLNSNSFYGFYCSGAATRCLWIRSEVDTVQVNSQDVYRPCNNLQFYSVIMEPPYTEQSHIYIEGGGSQCRMHEIRVEAAQQDTRYPQVPVIYLGPNTNGCLIEGDQTNVTLQDLGYNNYVPARSVKNGNSSPATGNLWKNSGLVGLVNDGTTWALPEWVIEEQCVDPTNTYAWRPLQVSSAISVAYDSDVSLDAYRALAFSVPPSYQLRITQGIDRVKQALTHLKFNSYVKTTTPRGVIYTYQDSVTPITSFAPPFGTGAYEPIGGLQPITNSGLTSYFRLALFAQNASASTSNINFSFTRPSCVKGDTITSDTAMSIKDNGGSMYGLLALNTVKNIAPVNNAAHRGISTSDIILPIEGNYFEIVDTGFNIDRVNATTNRFPRGSVITLYFVAGNVTIANSSYINLTKEFTADAGASIDLQSVDGNGLWRELRRYSKRSAGLTTVDLAAVADKTNSGFITLPVDGSNLYVATNVSGGTYSIQRINNVTRMAAGTEIMLTFSGPGGTVNVVNSAYLTLAKVGSFTPADGDWLKLVTTGNGAWLEVARKQSTLPLATKGSATIDFATAGVVSGTTLVLSQAGENYFILNNTSAAGVTINRINDAASQRLLAGTEITLNFNTLTNAIALSSSAYLVLNLSGTYTPATGDWVKLVTDGNGIWRETGRKPAALPVQTKGVATVVLSSGNLASGFLTLSKAGENFFKLDATSVGGAINRINNDAANRLAAGTIIVLKFINVTTAVTLAHSGFLNLAGAANFVPALNNTIGLITAGDGNWEELYRRTT